MLIPKGLRCDRATAPVISTDPASFQLTQSLPHRSTNQASPVSLDQPADGESTSGENMDLKEPSLGGLFFTSLRYKAEQSRVGQDMTGYDRIRRAPQSRALSRFPMNHHN